MAADAKLGMPEGSACRNQEHMPICEDHLLPIYWGTTNAQRKTLLNHYLDVVLIVFDTDNKLVVIHTPVLTQLKYHPSNNRNHRPPTTVGEKGEIAIIVFR